MSITVSTAVRRRIVGSATMKSVLLYMADSASDDGSGIWTSKANMAADLELSKRAVQLAIQSLEQMGVVSQSGTRACARGFTVEYRINEGRLLALPCTRQSDQPRGEPDARVNHVHLKGRTTFTSRGESGSPKPSLEPSFEPSYKEGAIFEAGKDQSLNPKVAGQSGEDQFEKFWKAYPMKPGMSKKNARAKFTAALAKVSCDDLMRAVRAYAASREGEDWKYTRGAEVWLSGEYWTAWLDGSPIDPERARLRAITAEALAAQAGGGRQ